MTKSFSRPVPHTDTPTALTDTAGVEFMRRHPVTLSVATTTLEAGVIRAQPEFPESFEGLPPVEAWVVPNVDVPTDRPHDLAFENAGHSPPPGFWMSHPEVLAWTLEFDMDDGANWWVKVWLKDA